MQSFNEIKLSMQAAKKLLKTKRTKQYINREPIYKTNELSKRRT